MSHSVKIQIWVPAKHISSYISAHRPVPCQFFPIDHRVIEATNRHRRLIKLILLRNTYTSQDLHRILKPPLTSKICSLGF